MTRPVASWVGESVRASLLTKMFDSVGAGPWFNLYLMHVVGSGSVGELVWDFLGDSIRIQLGADFDG